MTATRDVLERSPRILVVSHSAGRTGAPIGLLAFIRWLRQNTTAVVGTILRAPGPLEPAFRELGPTLTLGRTLLAQSRVGRRIRRLLPVSLQNEVRAIRRFFAAGGYDVIYSNTMTNGFVLEALAAFGVPVITHVHELAYWIRRSGAENLRQVIAHTSSYIAASGAVRDHLITQHHLPSAKVRVVYEHISELPAVPSSSARESARLAFGIPPGAFVVGGCGAEHWRKGRDLIPQLLVALRRTHPRTEIHFVWIGRLGTDEEEEGLRHDLNAGGVASLYHTSGEVTHPLACFPAFDSFALLSREDPYPLACLEAAAMEIPILCFENAGGMPEFAADGCGLVVPYMDIEQMAREVARLHAAPKLAAVLARAGRIKVIRQNTPACTGPLLLEVIKQQTGS